MCPSGYTCCENLIQENSLGDINLLGNNQIFGDLFQGNSQTFGESVRVVRQPVQVTNTNDKV